MKGNRPAGTITADRFQDQMMRTLASSFTRGSVLVADQATAQEFDILVLGGGSGGYATALRAVQLGLTVGLIEKGKLGGTCLHNGCIPTKALLHSAELADHARDSAKYGVNVTLDSIDITAVNAYKDGIIAGKFKGLQGLIKGKKGITVIEGEGKLQGTDTVVVNGTAYKGKNIVLATGSYSRTLPGLEIGGKVITSDEALDHGLHPQERDHPGRRRDRRRVRFGLEVLRRRRHHRRRPARRLVPNEDATIVKAFERAFKKRGIKFSTGVFFQGVEQNDDGVKVTLVDGKTFEADLLLVAVGRGPVTANLGYEEAGHHHRPRLRHHQRAPAHRRRQHLRRRRHRPRRAARAPRLPAGHLRRRRDRRPEAGHRRGRQHPQGHLLRTRDRHGRLHRDRPPRRSSARTRSRPRNTTWPATARAPSWAPAGLVKLVRQKDGPVVGVHMIGARMGEQIGEAQLIVNWEAYPEDVAQLVHAHPTQNESLGEAHLALAGKPAPRLAAPPAPPHELRAWCTRPESRVH